MSMALQGIDPEILEQVVVHGDLARLSPVQRLAYYAARCEAAGLDPRTRPFQYLSLQGKLTLYADKGCADQLSSRRGLTVEIISRGQVGDCYEVHVRVRRSDGTHVDDLGVVPLGGAKGEALANAVMKATTKGKRRAVLSACGLGMMDDSEIETVREARRITIAEAEAEAETPADKGVVLAHLASLPVPKTPSPEEARKSASAQIAEAAGDGRRLDALERRVQASTTLLHVDKAALLEEIRVRREEMGDAG